VKYTIQAIPHSWLHKKDVVLISKKA